MSSPDETPILLRRLTKLVAFSTLFLIFVGAMVTSTGSGLAVPDWPLAYGMVFPPMIAGIFFEHGHRLVAASVGLLTVVQAIWLQLREPKRFVRVLGWSSVGAVIAQGVLGGLTVIFLLPHAISIAHAGLAEIFLCLNASVAFFTSRSFLQMRQRSRRDVPVATTTALAGVVYLQILAGALVRHLGAGLAIPDFPLSFGHVIPAMTSAAIAANFAHRIGAACVTAMALVVVGGAWRTGDSQLRALSILLLGVIALQVTLGAEVVWHGRGDASLYHSLAGREAMRQALITSAHVVTGAATLAISLLMALSCRALTGPAARTAASLVQAEAAA